MKNIEKIAREILAADNISDMFVKFYNAGMSEREILSNMHSLAERRVGFMGADSFVKKLSYVLKELHQMKAEKIDKKMLVPLIAKYN